MANQALLEVLKQGSTAWNTWREQHPLWLDLDSVDLRRADLSSANLSGADLSGADLSGAALSGANLGGAGLSDANLGGADLSGANLSGTHLIYRHHPSDTILSETDLGGADLSGADLNGANLSGADLSGADLSDTNLSGASLIKANLSGADLSGADLSGADLGGANLSGADLSEVDLSGADLAGANLSDVILHHANLSSDMQLSQFMQFIRQTWALTPKRAMDLLNLKSLKGWNYRALLQQLQPLVEQQANHAPTSHQTFVEQDNENEQTRARARLKLGELKEMRGASTAHPARLAVLQTALNAQIDDHQLQRLIQAAWGAATIHQLKVNQVEALISWAKEDDFVKEVDGVLALLDEEEP